LVLTFEAAIRKLLARTCLQCSGCRAELREALNNNAVQTGEEIHMALSANTLSILAAFLGTAEEIVPIFIKNPQSQKIEAVVTTAGNNLFQDIATIIASGGKVTTGS
jgi:hypothetical protein